MKSYFMLLKSVENSLALLYTILDAQDQCEYWLSFPCVILGSSEHVSCHMQRKGIS